MTEAVFYYRDPNAPKPNEPTGIGVVALIERDGALLMEKRTDSDRWAVIGGALEPDESLLEAVVREVREETALLVTKVELFGTFSDPTRIIARANGKAKRIITIAYRVEVESFDDLTCSHESQELRFVPKRELDHIRIAETHLPILEACRSQAPVVLA